MVSEWIEPKGLLLIEAWARRGLTHIEIAKNIGIGNSTFSEWMAKYTEITEALKNGKEVVDIEVENALYRKAIGDKYTVRKPIKLKDIMYENGRKIAESERIEYVDEEIAIPADTTAQIFWLKNRRPQDWKDRPMDSAVVEQINSASEMLISIRKVVE